MHGGILVYVKRGIPCKRRTDLILINIECLWIVNVKKRVLVGIFYRPPNSFSWLVTDIETSVGMEYQIL